MKQFKEGVDFNYVIPEDENTTVGIKLLTGKYSGTVYQYGKVGFDEDKGGDIYVRFIYNITETTLDKEKLEKDDEFKNHIGDILMNIIEQNMDKGLIDEVGTDYTEEFSTK